MTIHSIDKTEEPEEDLPLFKRPCLDHGYVALVDRWGGDRAIIEAARMSTGKGFLGWYPGPCPLCGPNNGENLIDPNCPACNGTGKIAGDQKLLAFLYNNKHSTPFEMAGMTIEIQAPIFIYREWHRHRTQSYSEMSARYTPLPDLNYIPTLTRLMMNSGGSNKQAGTVKGAQELTEDGAMNFQRAMRQVYDTAEAVYQASLRMGVPKELSRIGLPVGRYSRMRASANLRNWIAFLTLRQASGAQWEIRQFANLVAELVKENFPRTYELYVGDLKESQLKTTVLGELRRAKDALPSPADLRADKRLSLEAKERLALVLEML